jgi:hypothetical protein
MVRVMEALQDPTSREPGRLEERLDHIRGVLAESFDWQEASRLILWRHWGGLTQDARDEFTALFADVTVRSYLRMIQTYRGDQIAMVLLDEAIDGDRAAVRTKLVSDRLTQHFGYGGMMKLLKLKQSQLAMEQSPQSTKIGRLDPSPASS